MLTKLSCLRRNDTAQNGHTPWSDTAKLLRCVAVHLFTTHPFSANAFGFFTHRCPHPNYPAASSPWAAVTTQSKRVQRVQQQLESSLDTSNTQSCVSLRTTFEWSRWSNIPWSSWFKAAGRTLATRVFQIESRKNDACAFVYCLPNLGSPEQSNRN